MMSRKADKTLKETPSMWHLGRTRREKDEGRGIKVVYDTKQAARRKRNRHYTNDIYRSLNETEDNKIRKYRPDYNNNPPNTAYRLIGKLTAFFAASGVQLPQTDRDQFHFPRTAFASQFKRRVDLDLAKATALRITLNLDGAPITSKSHTQPSHS